MTDIRFLVCRLYIFMCKSIRRDTLLGGKPDQEAIDVADQAIALQRQFLLSFLGTKAQGTELRSWTYVRISLCSSEDVGWLSERDDTSPFKVVQPCQRNSTLSLIDTISAIIVIVVPKKVLTQSFSFVVKNSSQPSTIT